MSSVSSAPPTALTEDLRRDVVALAGTIGERHVFRPGSLDETVAFLEASLHTARRPVQRHTFRAAEVTVHNLEVEIPGHRHGGEIVVVGAHYDTVPGSPGANDNATGVAALLALARRLPRAGERTLRLVFFVNEEPPFFQGPEMGSLVYAVRCRARRERIPAMIALDGLGCFRDDPGTQQYPLAVGAGYPTAGNFIALVSDLDSREVLAQVGDAFAADGKIPSQAVAVPRDVELAGWSDHWSFWQHGYPGLLVTDTLPLRDPRYHTPGDTPEHVDYGRLAGVVTGLEAALRAIGATC